LANRRQATYNRLVIMDAIKPIVALLLTLFVLWLVASMGSPGSGFGVFDTSASVETQEHESTTTTIVTPPVDPSAQAAGLRVSRALFDGVNRERRNRGQAELAWDEDLARSAVAWSLQLAALGEIEHHDVSSGLKDISPNIETFGENIFRSTARVSSLSIHDAWMQSDEHRMNIFQPGFDRLGVGVYCAPDGSVWATQEFGGSGKVTMGEDVPSLEPVAWADGSGPSCNTPI
jgi:uncharacterized protein YkwD